MDLQSFSKLLSRFDRPAAAIESDRQVAVDFGDVGGYPQRLLILSDRFGRLPLAKQSVAEIVVGVRQIGGDSQCLPVLDDRFRN